MGCEGRYHRGGTNRQSFSIKRSPMRNISPALILALVPLACSADPLVTITCAQPKGLSQYYGIAARDREKAASEHKQPENHLSEPDKDGFNAKPTFIVDSNRKKLTLLWAESAGETALRQWSKNLGTQWDPDPARDLAVIAYSPLVITAMDAHPGPNGSVDLYSFYPKLGIVYMARHYLDIMGAEATQSAFSAKCEFTWSGKP
jgi:hypothetical protein